MPEWISVIRWLDLVDIALVAGFCWLAIRYFRRTPARAALAGLALLATVYLAARGFELRLTAALLQGFFAVVVLVLVVVFQEDLRRVFEQIGTWRPGKSKLPANTETPDLLARTVARLAANRTGALIVLPGKEPLERHVEGGVALNGRVSEPLLLSIFDTSSPGHDGAVLLRGRNVERFALHLPLSADHAKIGPGGTRHAAALGLSERCDATCIVVSEERGTISVARDGAMRTLPRSEDLVAELRSAFPDVVDDRPWWRGRAGLDAALAVGFAAVLWTVFVPGSDESESTVIAGIEVLNLPDDLQFDSVEPTSVEVTVSGLRRDVLLAERNAVIVQVDAYLARMGRRTFEISADNVRIPDSLAVVRVEPDKVRLSLTAGPTADEPESP
jgi:uncharacterized protein (TIGR00159 family)